MDRKVKKIRKSISERNKQRTSVYENEKDFAYYFPDTEERHGFPPVISSENYEKEENQTSWSRFLLKAILATILFISSAIIMDSENVSMQKTQEVTASVFQKEFPFARVNIWYQELFGHPLSLGPELIKEEIEDSELVMPVQGMISESFQVNGKGVKISPGVESDVYSHQDGVVVFAGKQSETNQTIIVQHADGTNSLYGHLSDINVHLYQFVSQNQRIASFTPDGDQEAVYFSLEKDNLYIDPVDVIEVDDVP